MRSKLQKFTEFANSLLPHETEFLLANHRFEDQQKLALLRQVDHNCHYIEQFSAYDERIDKRKYSNLKQWIEERLQDIDVDAQYTWMLRMDQQIATDTIQADEEKILLRSLKRFDERGFYFTRFYELILQFRQYLLVRLRYAEHKSAHEYIEKYRSAYDRSRSVSEDLHHATQDIVGQYAGSDNNSSQWESWLHSIYYDEGLDGWNRYQALVRLTFLCFNSRKYEGLKEPFDYQDDLFRNGQQYSKRLLLNYYSNRLLLHAGFREYYKASFFGYLSIRGKNSDYLQYLNNLCAILLRQHRQIEALNLMRKALPDMKLSQSFHNKTGFVALYIRCLNANQLARNAENYAESFLRVYKKEVLEHRWHLFFTAFLESLLLQQKFSKALKIYRLYQLTDLDRKYQKNASYLPTLPWYLGIAEWKENKFSEQELAKRMFKDCQAMALPTEKFQQCCDLLRDLKLIAQEVVNRVDMKLNEAGMITGHL